MCVGRQRLEKQLTWVGMAARTERWRVGKGSGTGNEGRWHLKQVLLVMWHYPRVVDSSFSSCSLLQGSVTGQTAQCCGRKPR